MTDILEMRRRGALSHLFARCIPAMLCFAAGCTLDETGATATATQALGNSCTILRPLGWSGAANECVESRFFHTPITIPDGDSYFTTSAPGPGLGQGEITLICEDGVPVPDPWDEICIPDRGGGGGEDP